MFDIDKEMLTPDDGNPHHIKTSEEFAKEELWSIKNGFGGSLMLGYAIGQTLMVFSRKPGTAGVYVVAAWTLGIFVQGFWFYGHMENYGRIDATPYELLLAAQVIWWLPGLLVTLWRSLRGRHVPDTELGLGVFRRFFPRLNHRTAGLMSDMTTGSMLAGLFHFLGSPVQSNWYLTMIGWLLSAMGLPTRSKRSTSCE